jgi:hypothetical protein
MAVAMQVGGRRLTAAIRRVFLPLRDHRSFRGAATG